MMSLNRWTVAAACVVGGLACFMACEDDPKPNGTVDPCATAVDSITIYQPAAGDTLHVGTATSIEWCLPARVTGVVVRFSVDDGDTWTDLTAETVWAPSHTLSWTPGSTHITSMGRIRVENYLAQGADIDDIGSIVVQ
jgi:hypothetical protein